MPSARVDIDVIAPAGKNGEPKQRFKESGLRGTESEDELRQLVSTTCTKHDLPDKFVVPLTAFVQGFLAAVSSLFGLRFPENLAAS